MFNCLLLLLLLSFDTTLIWIFVTFLAIVLSGLLACLLACWLGAGGWGCMIDRKDWTGMDWDGGGEGCVLMDELGG